MTLKEKIYNHYLQVITGKIEQVESVLADLKDSGANETKSTAGDKHETALAMLQIEQANKREQLKELQQQKAVLLTINPALSPAVIVNGSLVKTNHGYLFLSVALGKAVIDTVTVTALSQHSPLGKQLLHLRPGQTAVINDRQYIIESIE